MGWGASCAFPVRQATGLLDGLDAKATEACYKFRFVPAKNATGSPVDAWISVQVGFTLNCGPSASDRCGEDDWRETVHLFLAPPSGSMIEGLAIVEVAEGEFAVAAVRATAADGSFDLSTTSPVDG
jgi:hypothetical protein